MYNMGYNQKKVQGAQSPQASNFLRLAAFSWFRNFYNEEPKYLQKEIDSS
jgi:hypothetical protein